MVTARSRSQKQVHEDPRLSAWNALGRALLDRSPHLLEAAFAASIEYASAGLGEAPFPPEEAELVGSSFADFAARIIDAGGAIALGFIIAGDTLTPMSDGDHVPTLPLAERAEQGRGRAGRGRAAEALVQRTKDYARRIALSAARADHADLRLIAGTASMADEEERCEYIAERFGPFARRSGLGLGEADKQLRDAGAALAAADSPRARLEASGEYAYACELEERAATLRPVQRLGLIAWMANLHGVRVPTVGERVEGEEAEFLEMFRAAVGAKAKAIAEESSGTTEAP
jgi:hypothetical protein